MEASASKLWGPRLPGRAREARSTLQSDVEIAKLNQNKKTKPHFTVYEEKTFLILEKWFLVHHRINDNLDSFRLTAFRRDTAAGMHIIARYDRCD